jgi:Ca2+-binding EF-hand superfamily protein
MGDHPPPAQTPNDFERLSDKIKAAYEFAQKGSSGLRFACFSAGLVLAVGAAMSLMPDLINPAHFVLDVYVFIFASVVALTEARIEMCTCVRSYSTKAKNSLGFLNSVYGRGFFYVGVGALALSHFWNPIFKVAGVALFVLGFANIYVGRGANKLLDEVSSKITSEAAALKLFELYDVDKNKKLDKNELGKLVQNMSSPLSPAQLEAAVRVMDSNQDGTVSQQEFMQWWGSKQTEDVEIVTTSDDVNSISKQITIDNIKSVVRSVRDGPKAIHFLCVLAGLMLAAIAGMQAFTDLTGLSPSKAAVDAYLCFFGIVIVLLEEKTLACSAAAAGKLKTEARFLESAQQRGCFYVFVGSLAFVQSEWRLMVVGGVLLALGVAGLVFGRQASQQLNDLRARMVNEGEVRAKFDECANVHLASSPSRQVPGPPGSSSTEKSLNLLDLAALTASLGLRMNHSQLVAAHEILDGNNDGVVSYDEFLAWWKGARFDQFNQVCVLALLIHFMRLGTPYPFHASWHSLSLFMRLGTPYPFSCVLALLIHFMRLGTPYPFMRLGTPYRLHASWHSLSLACVLAFPSPTLFPANGHRPRGQPTCSPGSWDAACHCCSPASLCCGPTGHGLRWQCPSARHHRGLLHIVE